MFERDAEIGGRIAEARKLTGARQTDIAELIGVDATTVSKIEAGKRRLDGYELALIADALGTTSRALLGMPTRSAAIAAAARSAGSSPAPALSRARELLEIDGMLDQIGVPQPADPKRPEHLAATPRSKGAIEQLAREVRDLIGVGQTGIGDLVGVAEHHFGIDVAIDSFGDDGPSGVLVQCEDDVALTVLNGDDRRPRQRFTLAHEIGHWLLGDTRPVIVDQISDPTELLEQRANQFASAFLMPADGVSAAFEHRDGVAAFVDAMIEFGVSREALSYRVNALGLLPEIELDRIGTNLVRNLFAQAGRSSDHAAWDGEGPAARVPARMERRLRTAYTAGQVGIGLMAQAFGVDTVTLGARLREEGVASPHVEVDDATLAAI